jgi:hypothetical protein
MGWLQALHTIVCGTKSRSGVWVPCRSMRFPNEMLQAIVERTGGRPVQLAVPKVSEGTVEIDDEGRCFLVEQHHGARRAELYQGDLPDGGDAGWPGCLRRWPRSVGPSVPLHGGYG